MWDENTYSTGDSVATINPARRQPLLEQSNQRSRCLRLSFRRNLLNDGLDGAFNQHTQDGIRFQADHACHGDRLGENAEWIGPVGSDALHPAAQPIDGWEMAVWHGVSMTDRGLMRQGALRRMFLICSRG